MYNINFRTGIHVQYYLLTFSTVFSNPANIYTHLAIICEKKMWKMQIYK